MQDDRHDAATGSEGMGTCSDVGHRRMVAIEADRTRKCFKPNVGAGFCSEWNIKF